MSIDVSFKQLRKDYEKAELNEKDLDKSPFQQFEKWYLEILNISKYEANAMTLATVDSNMQPSARIVLLKGFKKDQGFLFYTNYKSLKGNELKENPKASILFYWAELERQIRIKGVIEKVTKEESDEYFYGRPIDAQRAAIASPQSENISKEELEKSFKSVSKENLKRPEHWGGLILKPNNFEFWQGRKSRMHDRLIYNLEKSGWVTKRIAP